MSLSDSYKEGSQQILSTCERTKALMRHGPQRRSHIPSSIKNTPYGVLQALACRKGNFSLTYLSYSRWAVNVAISAIRTERLTLVPYLARRRVQCLTLKREQYIPLQGCTLIRYDISYVESPMTSRLRETPQAAFSCCLFHDSGLFFGDSPVDVCIPDTPSGISLVF